MKYPKGLIFEKKDLWLVGKIKNKMVYLINIDGYRVGNLDVGFITNPAPIHKWLYSIKIAKLLYGV